MLNLKKGDFCIRLITVMGSTYASLARVDKVGPASLRINGDDALTYSRTNGQEDERLPSGMGSSRIVEIDGGQQEIPGWMKRLGEKV